jgi:hypothetical protein
MIGNKMRRQGSMGVRFRNSGTMFLVFFFGWLIQKRRNKEVNNMEIGTCVKNRTSKVNISILM